MSDADLAAPVEVWLTPAERDWAFKIGRGRHLADMNTKDARHYQDQSAKRYDDLSGNVASLCAEIAAAKFLDRYFDGAVWEARDIRHKKKRFADVGGDIEVRHVVERTAGMVVRPYELSTGRQVLCAHPDASAMWGRVLLLGTLPAAEAWERGRPVDGQDYRRCPQKFLRPADTLLTQQRPPVKVLSLDEVREEWERLDTWERDWARLSAVNMSSVGVPGTPSDHFQAAAEALVTAKVNDRYWSP